MAGEPESIGISSPTSETLPALKCIVVTVEKITARLRHSLGQEVKNNFIQLQLQVKF